MDDLDKKIKNAYLAKKLSKKQLADIVNQSKQKIETPRLRYRSALKYAALLVILISTVYGFYLFPIQQENKILNSFATEIAFNHQKALPVEIETSDLNELNKQLNKLNFKIRLPSKITDSMVLKGGRYCSVDNRIAAQLKLKTKNDEIVTCYVFKKEEKFNFDKKIMMNNVQVDLWNSDGFIYALAGKE